MANIRTRGNNMRGGLRRLALAAALTALLTGFVGVVTQLPAAAASCYGGQIEIPIRSYAEQQARTFPESGGYYTTTTRCNDIQVRLVDWTGTGSVTYNVALCWSSKSECELAETIQQNDTNPRWTILSWGIPNNWTFRIKVTNSNDWPYATGGYVAA